MTRFVKTGPRAAAERGSTMIEVLIAIVILALGMMGMLGLFLNSLKISSGAIYRNVATQHAYMMADSIRSSQANLLNYFSPTATATATCFNTSGCNATQIPQTEYKMWLTQLSNLLPVGQGVVCRDGAAAGKLPVVSMSNFLTCSGTGQVVVKVCWDESRIQTNNASLQNSTNTSASGGPACLYTSL